jgi:DNA-binding CsgD family transcriptional regulator
MTRLSNVDMRRANELQAELGALREGAPHTFSWLAPALRDLLGAEKAILCSYAPEDDHIFIEDAETPGISAEFKVAANRFLKNCPIRFTAFNPLRPEPWQRNRTLTFAELAKVVDPRGVPIFEVYKQFGMATFDQARVLVCEGASLLAFVGIVQSTLIDVRQRRLLTRLIPALRRRFGAERLLTNGRATKLMFDAALEEISGLAFVVSERGTVLEANSVGVAWLAHEGVAGRRALREACRNPLHVASQEFRVTKVTSPGVATRFLVVKRDEPRLEHSAKEAGKRWGFSARENDVLTHLAEGMTNRSIAAALAISERTVEVHLTSMFDKAQVESRSELVAKSWRAR